MQKPSHRLIAKSSNKALKRAENLKRLGAWVLGILAIVGTVAGVVSAWQPARELASKSFAIAFAAPHSVGQQVDPKVMTLLDNRFEQRYFYFIDKSKTDTTKPFLIQFPFSFRNITENAFKNASLTFSFQPTEEELISSPPSLADPKWPFLLDFQMNVADHTGISDLTRKVAVSAPVASVTFAGMNVPARSDSFLQFHFAPRPYPVSIKKDGATVDVAVYNVRATFRTSDFSQTQHFRVIVLPSENEDDFAMGVKLFSTYFGCKKVCSESWPIKQIRNFPWLAAKLLQEYENVRIFPETEIAISNLGQFPVLRPSQKVAVDRFTYVNNTSK